MKNIIEIYSEYKIMPQLQEHQLRVAGVASLICENFQSELDAENVVKACLLHDMGNLIKFDLQKTENLLNEKIDLVYWQKVQADLIKKYGTDEHLAHQKIAREIGCNSRVVELVGAISFVGAPLNAQGIDFGKKIVQYCDDRVTPRGVVSLEERLQDLRMRYAHKGGETAKKLAFEQALREIEKQIFEHCKIKPNEIDSEAVNKKITKLKNYLI